MRKCCLAKKDNIPAGLLVRVTVKTSSEKTTLIARVVLCSSGGFKANTVALSISVFSRILVPPSIV